MRIPRSELLELTRTRILGTLREPEAMFWVFVFPLVLAVGLGLAFRESGPTPARVVVLPGPGAADVTRSLAEDALIEVVAVADDADARARLRRGAVDLLVEPGSPPVLHFDPERPEAETSRLRVDRALQRAAGRRDPLEVGVAPVTERGSRYIDFLIPGLLGMNLMSTGVWGIAFAIADLRQRKLLKRMLVTPMRRTSLLLSYVLGRLVWMVLEVALLTVFGMLVLGVPFRGSILAFTLLSLTGALAFAAIGILGASRARTIEGASGLVNLLTMPLWIAGGIFFSYERFPEATHGLIRLLPLPPLTDGLREVMLGGAGVGAVLPQLGVLAAWALVAFFAAHRLFRWR